MIILEPSNNFCWWKHWYRISLLHSTASKIFQICCSWGMGPSQKTAWRMNQRFTVWEGRISQNCPSPLVEIIAEIQTSVITHFSIHFTFKEEKNEPSFLHLQYTTHAYLLNCWKYRANGLSASGSPKFLCLDAAVESHDASCTMFPDYEIDVDDNNHYKMQ